MPDVDVTISGDASGLVNATNQAKASMESLARVSQTPVPTSYIASIQGASKTPLLDAATAAAKRNSSALNELSEASRQTTAVQDAMGKATGGATGQFERMATRMVERIAILWLIKEVFDQIKAAVTEAAEAQMQFAQIQNITGQSTQATEQTLERLKTTAHETALDLEKSVIPTYRKMLMAGMPSDEALDMTERLSRVLKETGIDLGNIAAKAEIGAASFSDMIAAGQGFGDQTLVQWAKAWEKAQVQEAYYNRETEHTHELMMRQIQDQERLTGAHEEFAQKTGVAQNAFQAFQKGTGFGAGVTPATWIEIPRSLANLPGGVAAARQLGAEMQQHLQQGMEQIAKEENLPLRTVQLGVTAGLPGFDQQSLLAAQKRAVEEGKIGQERKDADARFERTKGFDEAKISGNKEVERLLKTQKDDTERLAKATQTVAGIWDSIKQTIKETQIHIGDVINEINKLHQPAAEPGVGNKPSGMALWDPRIRSQLEYLNTHPEMLQGTPVGPPPKEPLTQEVNYGEILQNILGVLKQVFRGG